MCVCIHKHTRPRNINTGEEQEAGGHVCVRVMYVLSECVCVCACTYMCMIVCECVCVSECVC